MVTDLPNQEVLVAELGTASGAYPSAFSCFASHAELATLWVSISSFSYATMNCEITTAGLTPSSINPTSTSLSRGP